jgi:hypothetical protein
MTTKSFITTTTPSQTGLLAGWRNRSVEKSLKSTKYFEPQRFWREKLTGDNLKLVWAEFSTLSKAVSMMCIIYVDARPLL